MSDDQAAVAVARAARLAREIDHHQEIAQQAELIWNWDSPSGRRRADRRVALYVEHAALAPGRRALERLPLVREIAGSLLLVGRKP